MNRAGILEFLGADTRNPPPHRVYHCDGWHPIAPDEEPYSECSFHEEATAYEYIDAFGNETGDRDWGDITGRYCGEHDRELTRYDLPAQREEVVALLITIYQTEGLYEDDPLAGPIPVAPGQVPWLRTTDPTKPAATLHAGW